MLAIGEDRNLNSGRTTSNIHLRFVLGERVVQSGHVVLGRATHEQASRKLSCLRAVGERFLISKVDLKKHAHQVGSRPLRQESQLDGTNVGTLRTSFDVGWSRFKLLA